MDLRVIEKANTDRSRQRLGAGLIVGGMPMRCVVDNNWLNSLKWLNLR